MDKILIFFILFTTLGSCASMGTSGEVPKTPQTQVQDEPILLPGVYVEKNGNMAKVTFVYENPDAETVGLAGSFQNWNVKGAIPLKKNANGMWRIAITARPDAVVLYKFVVDGRWTEDPNAPEKVGDGYDGNNGRIDIDRMLK